MEDVDFDRTTDSQNPAEISICQKILKETLKVSSMPSAPSSQIQTTINYTFLANLYANPPMMEIPQSLLEIHSST